MVFNKDLKSIEYDIKGIIACIDFIEGIMTVNDFMKQLVHLGAKIRCISFSINKCSDKKIWLEKSM